jgi:hypothetical protein
VFLFYLILFYLPDTHLGKVGGYDIHIPRWDQRSQVDVKVQTQIRDTRAGITCRLCFNTPSIETSISAPHSTHNTTTKPPFDDITMAQRSPGRCRLFEKGSCKHGSKCKYAHVLGSPGPTPARPSGTRPQKQPGSPSTPGERVPANVCRMYWTTGSCNRSFDCSFKHVKGSNAPAGSSSNTGSGDAESDVVPDVFTAEGFATHIGSGVDEDQLSPAEAHNHAKIFLKDNYQFTSAGNVKGFVRIFASINDRNKAWVRPDQCLFR